MTNKEQEPKKEPLKPQDLVCRFCGAKTGEFVPPERLRGKTVTAEDMGYIDIRCDDCVKTKGTYAEAETHYRNNYPKVGRAGSPEHFAKQFEAVGRDASLLKDWVDAQK